MARIGLFGGSFDPPTFGHAYVVETALLSGAVDALWLIPTGDDRYDRRPIAAGSDRTVMLQCMTNELFPGAPILVSQDQISGNLPSGSATIDLVRLLKNRHPADSFAWIIGADNLSGVPHWREFHELIALMKFLVVARPGITIGPATLPWATHLQNSKLQRFAGHSQCSSTTARELLKNGPSSLVALSEALPATVLGCIRERGLYC